MKKAVGYILLLLVFTQASCVSYIIGYYGYDKNKIRRHSQSKEESIRRGVFIKDLNYSLEIPIVKKVYFEKAYRWGRNYKITHTLTKKDTLARFDNEVDKPYNISIEYLKDYNGADIYFPKNSFNVIDTVFSDTLYLNVFVHDSLKVKINSASERENNYKKIKLKIWMR
jgi:hypothetical protein